MPFECMAGAPLLRQSDKARLVIALVIARHVPNTLTPVEYVRRLRSAFPEASTGIDTESRWLERIEVLQRELECARANEARAKLELVSYQTQHPPPSSAPGIDNVPVEEPITKRSAPDSPASGSRRHPKKKRKQGGVPSMNSSSKPSSSDLELALERIHSGKLSSEDSGSISDLDYLVRRCLTDVASHMRHVCANPTAQRSLDGLNALQVVLPTILVAGIHICNAGPEFVHTLITLVLPMIHAIHPVTVAILHPATRATVPTRTRRGKPKTGVRAVRESEEVAAPDVVDIRPGLSVILSMVVRAGVGKDIMYAVLPEACKKIRELCVPVTQSRASDRRTTWTRAWAVRDSIWYLCRACHTVLQGAYLTDQDAVFVGGCTDLLVDALQLSVCTETRVSDGAARPGAQEAHNSQSALIASRTQMNDAVRDMLCALLERIMLGFPSS